MSLGGRIMMPLQGLGRALMLPIAVLPVAGILLRLGQPDILDIAFVAAAGSAIFAHLGLIFAIGVGIGLARENHGAAGLAGAVAYLVLTEGAKALLIVPPEIASVPADFRDIAVAAWKDKQLAKLSVPAGIASGIVAGMLYNRYSTIRFPEYLAFFGGRRFVPIAAGFAGLIGAVAFGYGFPALELAVDTLSRWILGAGSTGLFIYGVLNRLLIITGLHHIINNLAWFVIGDFNGVTGDINRFFAGDKTAGAFTSGFFPVMIFGLPAACFAMCRAARPERRVQVGGMMLSLALTSALTGVTEPIEYTFMFVAPLLYALHAVLTGVSMVLMDALGVKLSFGFSAGLIDYALNFGLSTKPLLLLPVGAAYALVYYFAFSFVIRRFDLATPGRDEEATVQLPAISTDEGTAYASALGGVDNLVEVAACTTRLRVRLHNRTVIDGAVLKALGAKAVMNVGEDGVQVIIGPDADRIAGMINALLRSGPTAASPVMPSQTGAVDVTDDLADALGGRSNIKSSVTVPGRRIIALHEPASINTASLDSKHSGKWVMTPGGNCHVVD